MRTVQAMRWSRRATGGDRTRGGVARERFSLLREVRRVGARTAGGAMALSAAMLLVFPGAARAVRFISVDGATVESGGISGYKAPEVSTTTRQPGGEAVLYSVGGGERGDHACYLEFGFWRFTATTQEKPVTKWWEPPCADEHHSYQPSAMAGPLPPDGGTAYGISEIQVCDVATTNFSHRIKGVRITKMREIAIGGVQGDVAAKAANTFDRANCHDPDWRPPSRCPSGKVAIGVTIYHDDDSATGLELLCASARAASTSADLPAYSLDAATVHSTGISGFAGSSVRMGPALEKGYALYGLRSLERSDEACFLEGTSDLLREPLTQAGAFTGAGWGAHAFRTDHADRCGGGSPGDEVKVTATPTSTFIQAHVQDLSQTFVRGLRVCMNEDRSRLKGLELRGRRVGADVSGKFVLEDLPLDPDKARGARTHCHDDGWEKWVECSAGEVATAVVVHFAAGDPPRAVTGLALECARVKQP